MRYVTAIPAYNRDYTSAKAVRAGWAAGQDFLIQDPFLSGYVNKADLPEGVRLNIRYRRLTQICVIS